MNADDELQTAVIPSKEHLHEGWEDVMGSLDTNKWLGTLRFIVAMRKDYQEAYIQYLSAQQYREGYKKFQVADEEFRAANDKHVQAKLMGNIKTPTEKKQLETEKNNLEAEKEKWEDDKQNWEGGTEKWNDAVGEIWGYACEIEGFGNSVQSTDPIKKEFVFEILKRMGVQNDELTMASQPNATQKERQIQSGLNRIKDENEGLLLELNGSFAFLQSEKDSKWRLTRENGDGPEIDLSDSEVVDALKDQVSGISIVPSIGISREPRATTLQSQITQSRTQPGSSSTATVLGAKRAAPIVIPEADTESEPTTDDEDIDPLGAEIRREEAAHRAKRRRLDHDPMDVDVPSPPNELAHLDDLNGDIQNTVPKMFARKFNEDTMQVESVQDSATKFTYEPYARRTDAEGRHFSSTSKDDAVPSPQEFLQYIRELNNWLPWRSPKDISVLDEALADKTIDPSGRTPHEIVSIEYTEMDEEDTDKLKRELISDRNQGLQDGRYTQESYQESDINEYIHDYKKAIEADLDALRDSANAQRTGEKAPYPPSLEFLKAKMVAEEEREFHIATQGHPYVLIPQSNTAYTAGIVPGAALVEFSDYMDNRKYRKDHGQDVAEAREWMYDLKLKYAEHAKDDNPETISFSTYGAMTAAAACIGTAIKIEADDEGTLKFVATEATDSPEQQPNATHIQGKVKITYTEDGVEKTAIRPLLTTATLPNARPDQPLKIAAGKKYLEWINKRFEIQGTIDFPVIVKRNLQPAQVANWKEAVREIKKIVELDSTFDTYEQRKGAEQVLTKLINAELKRKKDPLPPLAALDDPFKLYVELNKRINKLKTVPQKQSATHMFNRMAEDLLFKDYKFDIGDNFVGLKQPRFEVSPERKADFAALMVSLRTAAVEAQKEGNPLINVDQLKNAARAFYETLVKTAPDHKEPFQHILATRDEQKIEEAVTNHLGGSENSAYHNSNENAQRKQERVLNMVKDIVIHHKLQERCFRELTPRSQSEEPTRQTQSKGKGRLM
ncbi:MAG: hypothetical protein V4568_20070 [Pseudomonadota bacterium]